MELIKPDTRFDFIGIRFKAFFFSMTLILLGLAVMFARGGLRMGVDFSGGTLIQVKFEKPTTPSDIRNSLKDLGLSGSAIQQAGASEDNEFLIRTDLETSQLETISKQVQAKLDKTYGAGQASVRRVEMVGPKVGQDLRQKALLAIYYAMLFIAIYISGRFEAKWTISGIMAGALFVTIYLLQALGTPIAFLIVFALILTLVLCWFLKLPYALAAVLALVHDVLITVGAFALTNKEFTLEVIAAILTLVGYSLNDTIIVFDRIRENLKKSRRQDFGELLNSSINQTLSRTVLTSGTTLIVVVCLFLWGGSVIHDFAFTLLVGILTGTYSSIFVACPLLMLYEDWAKGKGRRAVAVKTTKTASSSSS